jgi:hypothetical protein
MSRTLATTKTCLLTVIMIVAGSLILAQSATAASKSKSKSKRSNSSGASQRNTDRKSSYTKRSSSSRSSSTRAKRINNTPTTRKATSKSPSGANAFRGFSSKHGSSSKSNVNRNLRTPSYRFGNSSTSKTKKVPRFTPQPNTSKTPINRFPFDRKLIKPLPKPPTSNITKRPNRNTIGGLRGTLNKNPSSISKVGSFTPNNTRGSIRGTWKPKGGKNIAPGRITTRPSKKLPNRIGKNGASLTKHGGKTNKIGPNRVSLGKTIGKGKRPSLAAQIKSGKFKPVVNSASAKKFRLNKQFALKGKGDVARKLGLHAAEKKHGWRKFHHHGHVSKSFMSLHFGGHYAGCGYFPSYCWYPKWNNWVSWSWWDHCHSWCDPRPIWCQPIVYDPCDDWSYCEYPVWSPLPVVGCGTWVDVPEVVLESGLDLQMLAVRFVDSGHPTQKLGPRYRVWIRNNSTRAVGGFNVLLMASNQREMREGLPENGVRIENIDAGAVQSVDIRLPFDASRMNVNAKGDKTPFAYLGIVVDSHREIPEGFEKNNGAMLARGDILPVDPAAFSTDVDQAAGGAMINLAGEGLGPEPGQVIVYVSGIELQAEIIGWYDLGVRFKLPNLPLAAAADAEIVVLRGDGAATNPLSMVITPSSAGSVPVPQP